MVEIILRDNPADAIAARGRTLGALQALMGVVLALLGATVPLSWVGHFPLLVALLPGFPPMVVNTALTFMAIVLALIALTHSRRRTLTLLAGGAGILASQILVEHLLHVDQARSFRTRII